MSNFKGLKAAIECKCPQCRKGPIYQTGTYTVTFTKMHETCPVCHFKFEIEPGFFIGAMYVNYAFSVAQVIGLGFILNFFKPDATVFDLLVVILTSVLIFLPLTFRLSKSLYLYWFSSVQYDNKYA